MKVTIIAFRGVGYRRSEHKKEPALIQVGHVGIMFEDDLETIYGFHPTQETVDAVGGLDELINLLKKRERQPGTVQDDTLVFIRAYELAQKGELGRRTQVYQITYDLDDEAYDTARAEVLDLYQTQGKIWYNFPKTDGRFDEDECNCALFPSLVGIPIPSANGMVSEYIQEMRSKGATLWQPPKP
jgi:filamentous hemagglutinin